MAIQTIVAPAEETGEVELEHNLFDANAKVAEQNRALLEKHGGAAIDFMGAIGSGKTTLITKLVEKLRPKIGVAVLNGDPTTTDDYDALARQEVPIIQIATHGCHLDAQLVHQGLQKIELGKTALVFVENVGNLICPAEFPLGSKARVVVISVTEGPYMVKKHPHMFLGADLVVINKIDLAEVMGVSAQELTADVHRLKPGLKVIQASGKNGVGVDEIATILLTN
jgi:hydrogenase nickel incorporation protein HypB